MSICVKLKYIYFFSFKRTIDTRFRDYNRPFPLSCNLFHLRESCCGLFVSFCDGTAGLCIMLMCLFVFRQCSADWSEKMVSNLFLYTFDERYINWKFSQLIHFYLTKYAFVFEGRNSFQTQTHFYWCIYVCFSASANLDVKYFKSARKI